MRQVNQDAFLERSEIGLWVVADGLGGHSDGEQASRMVCDAFADFAPGSSFDDTIEAARSRLQDVNDQLLLTSSRSLLADRSGSTVVALFVRGQRVAVLWAGDSRIYRCARGTARAVDPRPQPVGVGESGRPHGLARGHPGGGGPVDADARPAPRSSSSAGDRFLLCTDGLTRAVPTAQIKALVENPDIRTAVDGLIKATLDAGAPDNVTAVIVEARADAP